MQVFIILTLRVENCTIADEAEIRETGFGSCVGQEIRQLAALTYRRKTVVGSPPYASL